MSKDIINKQLEIYEKQFAEHGDSPEGTFNQNTVIQNLRFERLLKQFNLSGNRHSIHDIGCGICDLYDYIKTQNLDVEYSGTEIVPEMKVLANKKFPEIEISIRDIINDKVEDKYDIVVLAGTFNLPGNTEKKEWENFTREMIRSMYNICNVGISFNFLTSYADFYHDLMYYANPGELVDFCVKELSRFVTVDHSYPLFEQTVTVFRPEFLQESHPAPLLKKYFPK